ncbi:MAG: hypothetical protein MZU91_04660 [Desulfosudis oleivorans]|nr:hypothetical protein [Desulfosudis oleivorans]
MAFLAPLVFGAILDIAGRGMVCLLLVGCMLGALCGPSGHDKFDAAMDSRAPVDACEPFFRAQMNIQSPLMGFRQSPR